MRPILFAAAISAVATVAQAQATWQQQTFAEAAFSTEAPVRLAYQDQTQQDGWVMRNYVARDGADFYLIVAGRRTGEAAFSDAEEAIADATNYIKGFDGATVVYNRPGTSPGMRDLALDWQGRRIYFRTTHRHPYALGVTYATPLPATDAGAQRAQRFLSATHITQ